MKCVSCNEEVNEVCGDGFCRECHVSLSFEDCVSGKWAADKEKEILNERIQMHSISLGEVYCSNCDLTFTNWYHSEEPITIIIGHDYCPFCNKKTLRYLYEN